MILINLKGSLGILSGYLKGSLGILSGYLKGSLGIFRDVRADDGVLEGCFRDALGLGVGWHGCLKGMGGDSLRCFI